MIDHPDSLAVAIALGLTLGVLARLLFLAVATTVLAGTIFASALAASLAPIDAGVTATTAVAVMQIAYLAAAYVRHVMTPRPEVANETRARGVRDAH